MRATGHDDGPGGQPSAAVLLLATTATGTPALAALGARLEEALPECWRVFVVARGSGPGPEDALARAVDAGCRRLVVIPALPQFWPETTGRDIAELYGRLRHHGEALNVAVHATWHDDAGYVSALARWIAEQAALGGLAPESTSLAFQAATWASATYLREARRTAALVAERVGWPAQRARVVGRPEAPGDVPALRCPLDPLEPASGSARRGHVALAAFPPYIAALKNVALRGPRPVPRRSGARAPLLAGTERPIRAAPAALVSVGVSLEGSLGAGQGPRVRFSDPRALAQVRASHTELRTFLDWVREATPLREAFVWNTCQRMELYGWLPATKDVPDRERLLARIRRELFGVEPPGLEVNVLDGRAARHHVLRTACGLNSDLPGDRDVADQLQTACRRAESAGTAGALARSLVSEAATVADEVVAHTAWGRFSTGYCAAVLERIGERGASDIAGSHHVVVGGSTTSRSVLTALRLRHGVREDQLTSVYRDHHGQMKLLRIAVGGGRRLRVHAYTEACVLRAIAGADFVFFGIDQAEPCLDPAALEGLRDYGVRPLTIVDFNTFGSLATPPDLPGVTVWTAAELDHEVAMHAAITTTHADFPTALRAAEAWIARHLAATGTPGGEEARPGRPVPV